MIRIERSTVSKGFIGLEYMSRRVLIDCAE